MPPSRRPPTLAAPSPNQEPRPAGTRIDMLVLHYTGMPTGASTGAGALARLCDPAAKVSAHYLIETDGRVFALVPEHRRAWHAGVAFWAGARNINDRSIGIELVNPGHDWGYRAFPEAQMVALLALASDIAARHAIPAARVLGHSDVAPARKQDPGELFDWPRLAAHGLGFWPDPATPAPVAWPGADWVRRTLCALGYTPDAPLATVLRAFQRHFHPTAVTGRPDTETLRRLACLYRQYLNRQLETRGATS